MKARSEAMALSPRKALILFMRCPEPGKVKSRLAAVVGAAEALRIYEKLVRRTLGILAEFKRLRPEVSLFLFFHPPEKRLLVRKRYPGPWKEIPQEGSHLGEKMARAFQHVWKEGYAHAVMVGSDIADLKIADLDEAFSALGGGKAALGPASDGGFYLIGLEQPCPSIFKSESWSTGEVFERTRRSLRESGFSVHFLPKRNDVDRVEDLRHLKGSSLFQSRLSIIIPTLSFPGQLLPLLERLRSGLWPGDSITVVQGHPNLPPGSERMSDEVQWITAPAGRGLQLNRGVEASPGDLLWFLHDDCLPPPHFSFLIKEALRPKNISLGCFRPAFSASTPALDLLALWANLRTEVFKLPYGDQGIFCPRTVFEKTGGFRKLFIMEDVDFVRNARKCGRLAVLPHPLYTSAARYLKKGVLRAGLQNHLTMLLYCLGVDDRKLHSYYYKDRRLVTGVRKEK